MPNPNPIRLRNRIAVAAVAVATTLVVAEALLRTLPSGLVVEPDLYRIEDGLLLLRPNLVRRHLTPLWDVTIQTNADGWRDFAGRDVESAPIVIGLGDSQAFGWGVELEQTLYARIEAELGVGILAAAVPGTGTSDQARLLERLLTSHRPKLVLLTFFVGNDFVDCARGGSAQYEVSDGFLAHAGSSSGNLRRLAIRSRLLQLLRAAQFRLSIAADPERRWDEWMREYAEIHLSDPPPRSERAVRAGLEALDAMLAHCRRSRSRLLFVVAPRSFQLAGPERERMLAGLGWRSADLDIDRPQRILASWAADHNVAFVDLLPAFRAHQGAPLFYSPDAHMTAEGHRLAAAELAPPLAALLAE